MLIVAISIPVTPDSWNFHLKTLTLNVKLSKWCNKTTSVSSANGNTSLINSTEAYSNWGEYKIILERTTPQVRRLKKTVLLSASVSQKQKAEVSPLDS